MSRYHQGGLHNPAQRSHQLLIFPRNCMQCAQTNKVIQPNCLRFCNTRQYYQNDNLSYCNVCIRETVIHLIKFCNALCSAIDLVNIFRTAIPTTSSPHSIDHLSNSLYRPSRVHMSFNPFEAFNMDYDTKSFPYIPINIQNHIFQLLDSLKSTFSEFHKTPSIAPQQTEDFRPNTIPHVAEYGKPTYVNFHPPNVVNTDKTHNSEAQSKHADNFLSNDFRLAKPHDHDTKDKQLLNSIKNKIYKQIQTIEDTNKYLESAAVDNSGFDNYGTRDKPRQNFNNFSTRDKLHPLYTILPSKDNSINREVSKEEYNDNDEQDEEENYKDNSENTSKESKESNEPLIIDMHVKGYFSDISR